MRFSSIRVRVAIVSTVFALALVGTVAIGTYVLVANGMRSAAMETADRLAGAAERAIASTVRTAEAATHHDGGTAWRPAGGGSAALVTGSIPRSGPGSP